MSPVFFLTEVETNWFLFFSTLDFFVVAIFYVSKSYYKISLHIWLVSLKILNPILQNYHLPILFSISYFFAVDYFCLDNLSNLLQNEILTCMILVLSIPTTSAKKPVICWPFLVSSAHSLPSLLNSRPILSFLLPVTVFVIIFWYFLISSLCINKLHVNLCLGLFCFVSACSWWVLAVCP